MIMGEKKLNARTVQAIAFEAGSVQRKRKKKRTTVVVKNEIPTELI